MALAWRTSVVGVGAALSGIIAACASLEGLTGGAAVDGGPPEDGDARVDGDVLTSDGALRVQPSAIALETDCGGQAASVITVENASDRERRVTVLPPVNASYRVANAQQLITIPPRGSARFDVALSSPTTPGVLEEDIQIVSESAVEKVHVSVRVHGAKLAFVPSTLDFGYVHMASTSSALVVKLENTGDRPASFTGFDGAAENFVTLSKVAPIDAVGSADFKISMKPGPIGKVEASVTPIAGSLCGDPPKLTLRGERQNEDILASPGVVDLGRHDCKTSPSSTATVTLSNYATGSQAVYTATLPSSSPFFIVSGESGPLPKAVPVDGGANKAGTATITVGLHPTGETIGSVTDKLHVVVTSDFTLPKVFDITLNHLVTGAVIQLVSPPVTFDPSSHKVQKPTLKNAGNAATCAVYTLTTGTSSQWGIENDDVLAPETLNDIDVTFRATTAGTYNGVVTISPGLSCDGVATPAPFCSPAPTLPLKGVVTSSSSSGGVSSSSGSSTSGGSTSGSSTSGG